jgi:DNA-binding response OmpR family regulator
MIILDVMMPGLAGLPRFRALRERLPDTPVLFISGFSREAAVQDLLDAGAEELIHKPFRIETLARAVRAALEKGARATPAAS